MQFVGADQACSFWEESVWVKIFLNSNSILSFETLIKKIALVFTGKKVFDLGKFQKSSTFWIFQTIENTNQCAEFCIPGPNHPPQVKSFQTRYFWMKMNPYSQRKMTLEIEIGEKFSTFGVIALPCFSAEQENRLFKGLVFYKFGFLRVRFWLKKSSL